MFLFVNLTKLGLACKPLVIHILVPLITRSSPTLLVRDLNHFLCAYVIFVILLTPVSFSADTKNTLIPDLQTPKKHKIHQNTLIHIFCHQAENFDTGTAGDKYQVCLCVFDMGHLAEVVREATSLPPPGSLTWKKCSLTWKFKNSLLGSCQRASFPVFNLSPPHLYSLT